jgi:phosphoribosylglycinamide formyltransferase 1
MSIRLAILISGSGSTAEAILRASNEHTLSGIKPVVVISSSSSAQGVLKAKALGFSSEIVDRKRYNTSEDFGDALLAVLKKYRVDFLSQNGWLPLTPNVIVKAYDNRIINQHPGPLDPGRLHDFGGKGMFGKRVSLARVAFCWATGHDYWTESTVHMVNNTYDQGELVRVEQSGFEAPKKHGTIAELEKDSSVLLKATDWVSANLLPIEHHNVLSALRELGTKGRISGFRRKTPLISKDEASILIQSKQLAQKLIT